MNSTSDSPGVVEQLAEEFLARHKRGEKPTIREYYERHPEHADEIRDVFEALLMVEELKPGSRDGSGLESNAAAADGPLLPRIGDYRILRELGRGGMGIVYEAEQETLGRRVALKVLQGALAIDGKARARFDREARAAARMHHTNIVPVFDVGHEQGQFYYAMQMIRGQGLDLVIDELKRLRGGCAHSARATDGDPSLAESLILGRFEQQRLADLAATQRDDELGEKTEDYDGPTASSAVLPGQSDLSTAQSNRRAYHRSIAQIGLQTSSALSYAHARGVVHRDVKPSNLILDAAGVVWVTDFGLAKTSDLGVTQTGDILGTLRYMAPERFRGQCDVRADIYGLGLTLYELLTLKPAFATRDRLALVDQIRTEDPPSPRSADGKLPRDLETIVLKAIEKEPRRRYQSADELGADLQRFLADEPVQARRIWLPERVGRWIHRNPIVAGLTAIVFLAMGLGTAVSTRQASRARSAEESARGSALAEKSARAAAEAHAAESLAVLDFVENRVFAAARPAGEQGGLGREVPLRKAIEASLPYVALSFSKQPLIEARLRRTLGKSFLYLGEWSAAQEQLESARKIYTRFLGSDHPDTLKDMHDLAISYAKLDRYTDSLALLEETVARRTATLGPDHADTLMSMNNLGVFSSEAGHEAKGLRLHEETLARRKAKLGPDHPDTLQSMSNLAWSFYVTGRQAEALALEEEALARRRAKLGHDHPQTLESLSHLADIYAAVGRFSDALKIHLEVLPLRQARLGPDHSFTLQSMTKLADVYAMTGRHSEALKLCEDAVALEKAKLGPDHRDTLLSQVGVVRSLVKLGRGREAVSLACETAELFVRRTDSSAASTYNAACCRALAVEALRQGDRSPEDARCADAQAEQALARLKQAVAAGYTNLADFENDHDLDALRDRADFQALVAGLKVTAPSRN